MSKDEANTMSDKPAAVEHGGEGDAGRERMQALDRLESEIAQAPVDRGSWGAPEYVTVASIIDLDESPSLPRVDGDTFAYVAREKLHHMIADGLSSPKRGRRR